MNRDFLIVGLGNPGKAYERTRHNIGFQIVEEMARQSALTLRKKFLINGRLAHGVIEDCGVYLFQPGTYMNRSGEAVDRVMKKFGIEIENLLVIVDDVALAFGQLRLKAHSSSGGHNGLKSIEENLGTNSYARLRVGVGDDREGDLASYVLAPFTPDEKKLVPEVLGRAAMIAKIWLTEGLTSAMNHANIKVSFEQ